MAAQTIKIKNELCELNEGLEFESEWWKIFVYIKIYLILSSSRI